MQGGQAHAVAGAGIGGGSGALPHLERIQAAFGHHDVTGVQAHTGSDAAQASRDLGAHAYAYGEHVAFAEPPSLHTAAHEAAHVVQQGSGIHLEGAIGQAGDVYERHADQVADAVVQGGSVEGLLDRMAPRGTRPTQPPGMVQLDRNGEEEQEEGPGNWGEPFRSTIRADLEEARVRVELEGFWTAMGREVRQLYHAYLSRRWGDDLTPVELREPGRVALAFRDSPEIREWQDGILGQAEAVLPRLEREYLQDAAPDVSVEVPLEALGDYWSTREVDFGDAFSIPGHLAGGVSGSDAGQDSRRASGCLRLTRVTDDSGSPVGIRIEPALSFEVSDCVDFLPGGAGSGLERHITVTLSRLEASDRAYDQPFRVTFSGPEAEPRLVEPSGSNPPPGEPRPE